jgi:tetratricopeptide (TPR) repeat protein
MKLELRSPLRKVLFAGICLVFLGLYLHLALRAYRASHLAAVADSAHLQNAIRLEPANAEYRDLLGRNLALSGISLGDAISNYRTAVSLNPYEARYWLDLAGAYQIAGRTSEQKESVERALEADPTTPHVAWEAANFFLVRGDSQKALRYFRVVFANDDIDAVDSALVLCWRETEDADQILDRSLPPRADLYLRFLHLLISKQQVKPAESVWNRLIELHQPFSIKLAFPYFQFLLGQQEVAGAQSAWQQLARVDRSLERYLPSRENLIVNGGFEEKLLNGGFDWWYQQNSHVALAIDTGQFHSGTRSLSITFDGLNASEAGIEQLIPVKPDTDYEFSAECRTEALETASGPRFAITDAYSNASYVLTDDLVETNPWRLQEAQFHTGTTTRLVLLKIVRRPENPLIRGSLWIDDLKLVEKASQDTNR